ncbi:hypothetical protein KFL_002930060 [Klebsormidium nitens]|uniref:Alpha/beta hydrolase fold-5 domain-containing protein n=1 Tax=Klebsormidium nitens TaxID=105231 RepID=A0A1Y1IAQ2_KLENI|nr:hypothetical protein KFL_002930060 [Klebsormidium nitens]|eukprot:GAQ86509.1 hypothetical protein KFL_002930060 [Klebsormidium nitens]
MGTASGPPRIFAFLLVLLAIALPIVNAARIASSRGLLQEGPLPAPTSAPTSAPPSATATPSPEQGPVSALANAPTIGAPAFSPQQGAPVLPVVRPNPSNPTPAEGPVSVPVAAPANAPASNAPAGAPEQGPASGFVCPPNANATAALAPITTPTLVSGAYVTINVSNVSGVGYTFLAGNVTISYLSGGPNVTRGVIFLPEDGVDPIAYAPYARATALSSGHFVVIAADSSYGTVLGAMALRSDLQYWVLGGHGRGGTVAAGLAPVLYPKVRGLILLAATLPASLDLSSANLLVLSAYGATDTVVTSSQARADALRLPGDAVLTSFNLGHYDFAYSQCSQNSPGPTTGGSNLTAATARYLTTYYFSFPILLAQWAEATPRALSFGDNFRLTPGRNVSKPYPVNSTGPVTFQDILIPGTLPVRHWYVFSPPANVTRGGYIFLPGGAVDARAYFPVAFNIAAQGWLCVIIQQTGRVAGVFNSTDPTAVVYSTNPVFASVPKNKWAIGGHSAGGQGAAAYVAANPTRVFALVMLAGGIAPANLSTNPTPVVNIVGTLDRVSGPGLSYLRYQALVNPYGNPNVTLPLVPLAGGNHYQMGDYGYQYFDDIAVVSQDQQQASAAQLVVTYLDSLAPK